MATGDTNDTISRLQRWLPRNWFPTDQSTAPRIYALLSGFASLFSAIYSALAYAKNQTRIATSTDGFLDLASQDFFGGNLPRLNAELDPNFSMRIRQEVLRPKNTRIAIDTLLFQMTGAHPSIVELENPNDCLCWRGQWGWRAALPANTAGSNPVHYASKNWRYAVFITSPGAQALSFPNVGGWRGYLAGWREGTFAYEVPSNVSGEGFTDAQIFAALNRIRSAGITYWVNLTS